MSKSLENLSTSDPGRLSIVEEQDIRAPEINLSECNKCGRCVEVCPFDVFLQKEDGFFEVAHPERCVECGACKLNCRGDAIIFDPFPGCGCIWNATSRRLKELAFWRKTKEKPDSSSCSPG